MGMVIILGKTIEGHVFAELARMNGAELVERRWVKIRFVSLHHHTTFSNGDGHGPPMEHAERAHALGMTALGNTEHGNVSAHVQHEIACRNFGLKPIFGIEAYSSPINVRAKNHQTILAMNDEGYESLNRLVTQSYKDFYQYPTVTWENLKRNNRGLIVTTGCASSLTSCKLLGGKSYGPERDDFTEEQFRSVLRVVRLYQKVFGDRYYLEVQRFPGLPRVCTINQALSRISDITGIPLLATADVHYCHASQTEIQQALHAAHRGSNFEKIGADWEYDIPLTLPESDEEILQDLIDTGLSESDAQSAIDNTAVVASLCSVTLPKSRPLVFPIPYGISTDRETYFNEEIAAGIEYRASYGKLCDGPEYQERISHELGVMSLRPEFIDYFLFLSDLICWAKDQGIAVGPGRGSAAASLVCYLLRITEVDPMTVPTMVFERFMDPSRTDLPDIDIDIDDEDRWRLVEYLRKKYGNGNVGNVANIIRYRGKTAIDAVGMIYPNIPKSMLKPLKERIGDRVETDERVDDSVLDAIERYGDVPEIAELLSRFPQVADIACAFEGNVKTYGTHAAGYVVSSEPITNTCALYEKSVGSGAKERKVISVPYDKRDSEYLGMMKADLLGLSTMGMLSRVIDTVNKLTPNTIDLADVYAMDYDDPEILKGFSDDDLVGIFQFEGGTTRNVCKLVEPTSILDLSDINALARPGPLFSGAVNRYVEAKNLGDYDRIHPLYDQHVESTYGELVYQEQIMKVLRDLAGFDTVKVLRVRKIIGKKLGEFQFAELWEDFANGCANNGIDKATAWRVWSSITTAAGYAFNIAHSYSYSVIAYWSMYFKQNHPEAFYAASLAKNGDGKDDIPRRTALLKDAVNHGISIGSIDPYLSGRTWRVSIADGKRCLTPGFVQVPGIGDTTAEAMIQTQQALIDNPAATESSLYELGLFSWEKIGALTKGVGPKTVETIKAFAAQDDPFGVHRTERQLDAFRTELVEGEYDGAGLPCPEDFFGANEIGDAADWELVAWVGLVASIHHRDAVEYERKKTGKSVEQILSEMEHPGLVKHAVVFAYDEHDEVAIRFGRKIFPKWEATINQLKEDHHLIVVLGKKLPGMGNSLMPEQMWVLDPD